jgi:hypothetical protein
VCYTISRGLSSKETTPLRSELGSWKRWSLSSLQLGTPRPRQRGSLMGGPPDEVEYNALAPWWFLPFQISRLGFNRINTVARMLSNQVNHEDIHRGPPGRLHTSMSTMVVNHGRLAPLIY